MTKLTGVQICLPAYGHNVTIETVGSLYDLASILTLSKIPHQLHSLCAANITEVRNIFLTAWYDGNPNVSHCLMIDTDMQFKPDLVRDMLAFDKPLVGT